MARNLTAELMLQGQPLSGLGASSCLTDSYRDTRVGRIERKHAELGLPVDRW